MEAPEPRHHGQQTEAETSALFGGGRIAGCEAFDSVTVHIRFQERAALAPGPNEVPMDDGMGTEILGECGFRTPGHRGFHKALGGTAKMPLLDSVAEPELLRYETRQGQEARVAEGNAAFERVCHQVDIAVMKQAGEPEMVDEARHRHALLIGRRPTVAAILGELAVFAGEVSGRVVEEFA